MLFKFKRQTLRPTTEIESGTLFCRTESLMYYGGTLTVLLSRVGGPSPVYASSAISGMNPRG
jgi:hypothetical protein